MKRVFAVLLACVAFCAVAETPPVAGTKAVLELRPGPDNPRNSEGAFVVLRDGRIMFAYSRYRGTDGDDHGKADIAARFSPDGGNTWTQTDEILLRSPDDCLNLMSVSLLRLRDGRIAMFYLVKRSLGDCRPAVRFSSDEGKTWSAETMCIPDKDADYWVLNNDRVIQLNCGRLLFAVARHHYLGQKKHDRAAQVHTFYSDDAGATWRQGKSALEVHGVDGKRFVAQEPGVVELKNGSVMMFIRTNAGCQFISYSNDKGETFSVPLASALYSSTSPATIKRLETGDLLAIWNDHTSAELRGKEKRTPLSTAISRDDGRTWEKTKELESDRAGHFCYIAAQPLPDGTVLMGYCAYAGLAHTRITKVPVEWIYK